jgi:hypothetical protein
MANVEDMPPADLYGHSITRLRWKGRVFLDATEVLLARGLTKNPKRFLAARIAVLVFSAAATRRDAYRAVSADLTAGKQGDAIMVTLGEHCGHAHLFTVMGCRHTHTHTHTNMHARTQSCTHDAHNMSIVSRVLSASRIHLCALFSPYLVRLGAVAVAISRGASGHARTHTHIHIHTYTHTHIHTHTCARTCT